MLEWILRGLRKGIVTTRYPHEPELPSAGFRGRIVVTPTDEPALDVLESVCPVGAIAVDRGRVQLDRGLCILCGACVNHDPRRFSFEARYETARRSRSSLVVGDVIDAPGPVTPTLGEQSRTLKRSIHIRHVDAGSDGGEEWEIAALTNPVYDMQRLGLFFTLSPRHADILLVTGGVTRSMVEPLRRAYDVMPEPKAVVAAGTDACSGGFAAATGEVAGGVDQVLPVDVYVPGSPPAPLAILHGLLVAAGVVGEEVAT